MTSLRRVVRSRYSLVFVVVGASAFVAFAGHSLAATGLSRASGSPTAPCLTVAQSLARTAADIQAAAGKLTPVGAGIVNAAAAGAPQLAPAAAGFSAAHDHASLNVAIVATNVKNVYVNPAMQSADGTPPATNSRVLQSARHVLGSASWVPLCGVAFTANAVWYCKQASASCVTSAGFGGIPTEVKTANAGGCPAPNKAPCQVTVQAIPGPEQFVNYVLITQSASGAPVWGDRWCSFG